jgi:hypothetical protein
LATQLYGAGMKLAPCILANNPDLICPSQHHFCRYQTQITSRVVMSQSQSQQATI